MNEQPTLREKIMYAHVGDAIATARRKKYWTQDDLAKMVGLSRTSITNIEAGRQHATLHMLLRITQQLECSLFDILEEIRPHTQPQKPRMRLYPTERPL